MILFDAFICKSTTEGSQDDSWISDENVERH